MRVLIIIALMAVASCAGTEVRVYTTQLHTISELNIITRWSDTTTVSELYKKGWNIAHIVESTDKYTLPIFELIMEREEN